MPAEHDYKKLFPGMFEKILEEQYPDGIHTPLHSIKDDRTVKMRIQRLQRMPWDKTVKQAEWIRTILHDYREGLLTEQEYETLRDWKINW